MHRDNRDAETNRADGTADGATAVVVFAAGVASLTLDDILSLGAAIGLENGVEGVGDPELFERPGHQECGDACVFVGRCDKQVAQVLHRRALEPTEIAHRVQAFFAEWSARIFGQIELCAVVSTRSAGEFAHVKARALTEIAGSCHGLEPLSLVEELCDARKLPVKTVS